MGNRHPVAICYPIVCKEYFVLIKPYCRYPLQLTHRCCCPNIGNFCCLQTDKFVLEVACRVRFRYFGMPLSRDTSVRLPTVNISTVFPHCLHCLGYNCSTVTVCVSRSPLSITSQNPESYIRLQLHYVSKGLWQESTDRRLIPTDFVWNKMGNLKTWVQIKHCNQAAGSTLCSDMQSWRHMIKQQFG